MGFRACEMANRMQNCCGTNWKATWTRAVPPRRSAASPTTPSCLWCTITRSGFLSTTSVKHPFEHHQTLVSPAALIQPIQKPIYLAAVCLFIAPCCLGTETLGGNLLFRLPSLPHWFTSLLPSGRTCSSVNFSMNCNWHVDLPAAWCDRLPDSNIKQYMKKCNLLFVNLINWIKNTYFCCNILHPCFGSVNASVWTLDGAVGAAGRRYQNVSLCEFEKWH